MSQYLIEKNGTGILAFITDNSFLDSVSFRGMRWNLLKTYDTIYILNLHGNSQKKEISPEGGIDQNVFDIRQGVSINIFVKTDKKNKNDLAKVFSYDLYGKREDKYNYLLKNNLDTTQFYELQNLAPNYFFVKKDFSFQEEYDQFIKTNELFDLNGVGICSKRDETAIKFSKSELLNVLNNFKNLSETDLKLIYKSEINESRDKKTIYAKENILKFGIKEKFLKKINYRPFDIRQTYFTNKSKGFLAYPVYSVMQHFDKNNYGLIVSKKSRQISLAYMFITNTITDLHVLDSAADSTYVFPLYLYPTPTPQKKISPKQLKALEMLENQLIQANIHFNQISDFYFKTVLPFFNAIPNPTENETLLFEENKSTFEEAKTAVEHLENEIKLINNQVSEPIQTLFDEPVVLRVPNLNLEIVSKIAHNLDLIFTNEKENSENTFAPIDILDYIYAVLHSPNYREKYKEFLKIDFPKVPFPKNKENFWKLVKLGGEIRQIHLLESPIVDKFITSYPINGKNNVERAFFEPIPLSTNGRVYINENQYFEEVPELTWNFYVGGYQPAQKWLKDRKDRILDFEEINHYQKIIVALTETDRLMKEIDKIGVE